MAYRGEDLDLRTPQTWAVTQAELAGAAEASLSSDSKHGTFRAGPILVDDTVLACCNYAYDIAVAHRSAEVRIEHLLYAMTRIDAAASALESRGIRVASLRRETATIVASEIPVVPGSGPLAPRRSDDFAAVLRIAASLAARRNAAASIDDVLQTLVDYRSDFPASESLFRVMPRIAPRELPEPLPPLTRAGGDLRYPVGQVGLLRYGGDYPRGYRNDFAGSPADALQNSRIEALEQMVRALSQDLSNERHIVAGLVRDLSREAQAHQDDQVRRQAVLLDRIGTMEAAILEARGASTNESLVAKLENIETALELRLQEMSQSWAVLSTRLQELEASIRERPSGSGSVTAEEIREIVDLKPILNRLDIIEEAVLSGEGTSSANLGERFAKVEAEITRALTTSSDAGRTETLLTGLESIKEISNKFDVQQATASEAMRDLTERLAAVERAITAEIETAAAKHQAYAHDLSEVHEALMKINQNQHTLAGSMDQWRTEFAGDVATILNRLAAIDRDTALPAEALNALKAHMDTMNRLIIERYHRRHRFSYWLFGTDDWIGASWPSQKAALEAEKQRVKEAAEAQSA